MFRSFNVDIFPKTSSLCNDQTIDSIDLHVPHLSEVNYETSFSGRGSRRIVSTSADSDFKTCFLCVTNLKLD